MRSRSRDIDVSVVDAVEFSDDVGVSVGKDWLLQVCVLLLGHAEQGLPLVVHLRLLLLHGLGVLKGKVDLVLVAFLESAVEGLWVDFFEDGLEGVERLLKDLVPVGFCHVNDDGDEEGEGVALVSFENVEEIVIFEEAHGAVCHLKMQS